MHDAGEGERIKFNSPILFECTKGSTKDAGSSAAKLRLHLPPDETVICGSQTRATSVRNFCGVCDQVGTCYARVHIEEPLTLLHIFTHFTLVWILWLYLELFS